MLALLKALKNWFFPSALGQNEDNLIEIKVTEWNMQRLTSVTLLLFLCAGYIIFLVLFLFLTVS